MQDIILLYNNLLEKYGSQGWWPINGKYFYNKPLSSDNIFEIYLGVILTQNNLNSY